MIRASSCSSSGAKTTAVAASGLPSELGDSSAVGRGRAGRPDHDLRSCCIWLVESVGNTAVISRCYSAKRVDDNFSGLRYQNKVADSTAIDKIINL